MVATPMPGLEPEDIAVRIDGNRLVIHGEQRGPHQRDVQLSIAEWQVGPYRRELELPEPVDGALTNATYGNGVLVLSMPKASDADPGQRAEFRLVTIGPGRGERVGHVGRDIVPATTEDHLAGKHDTEVRPSLAPAATPGRRRRQLYQRILVPLDGSPEAEAILPLAEDLIDPETGELILLRAVLPYTPVPVADVPAPVFFEVTQEVQIEATDYVRRVAAPLTSRGLRVHLLTPTGEAAERIVQAARELGVQLIAMTTHGRSGLSRVVFGSVAEAVVREAPVPILLMRASTLDAARRAA
jgi:nucleotide-binding universal stress UspA family protein